MSKYNIRKNKPAPSDEEINKYKNFDKVVKKAAIYEYKQATRPIYKNVKFMGIVAVVVALGLIVLFENYEEKGINKPITTDKIIVNDTGSQIHSTKDSILKESNVTGNSEMQDSL